MAVIDSLEIDIQSKADSANTSLNNLVKQLGLIAEGINAIGKNSGLENFAKKAQEAVKEFSSIQNAAKGISNSITPEMQKVSKSLEEITAKYKDLGKNFKFVGSTAAIQKQIDSYSNALEKAKLKQQELEAGGKTSGQGYEDAIKNVLKYENVIASLKNQLAEMQSVEPQLNIDISGIEEAGRMIGEVGERIRESVMLSESAFNYDAGAMSAVFSEAAESIENWSQAVEQFGGRAGQIMNESTQLNIDISGIEEAQQNLGNFAGQIQNMKDLFVQTFSDLKSGEIFHYLSESVQNYVKNAQVAAGIKIYTEDYKTLQGDIERSGKALEKLQQKQRDMEAAGTSTESAEWQKVASEITEAKNRLDSYISKRNEMESGGTDVEFSGGLANQSAIKNIGVVAGEAMSSLRQKIGEIPGAVSQAVGNIPVIGQVAKEAAFLAKTAFEGFKSVLSGIAKVASTAVSALSKIASGIAKLVSSVKGAISKLSSMMKSFIGLKGASKSMNTSLGGGLKTILKYGLGIRSLYALINKLRTAMKEGFKNLAQYSSETNASLSSLKSSLGALQNSLATAFAPILNVVAPCLSMLIDMVTKAFNAVGQLFAALTGKSFVVQAKKNFSDYASGAEEANAAAKKLYSTTLGIDELNINSGDQDNGSDGGNTEISPADMFETVPIDTDISDFAQKIKDAWANADFTEIGTILGTKLKASLDDINWEPIKETAAKIGKSIGTLINGFVEVDGLANSIGRTIGEAVNTGISGINSFLDNTHWDSVGIFIGEGLNGIVNTVDWEGLGHLLAAKWNAIFEVLGNAATTFEWPEFGEKLAASVNTFIADFDWAENGARLGELAKGLLDSIISFLENTDWQALGNGIADFIGGVDWGGILERLAEGIGAALGGLAALLWGLIEDAWNSVVEWWQETAYEDGQFTIKGLLNGIWEGIKNIGSWIYEHIFTPFIDGFKEVFGIASPSKVMEEQGGFLMEGLFSGISVLVDKVAGVFTKIKDKIINVWNTLKTKTTEIWKDIKNNAIIKPINGIISAINGMLSGVGDGINGMINALNSIHFDIPDWVPGLGGKSFSFNLSNITMPKIPMLEVSAYAMGGFPEDGFFYANHNELVGKFSNGRTAVANNEQITTGIEEAAYRGMMRALAESRENENQDAIVSLLSEQNNMLANGEVRAVMDTREALAALRTQAKRNGYVFST